MVIEYHRCANEIHIFVIYGTCPHAAILDVESILLILHTTSSQNDMIIVIGSVYIYYELCDYML